MNSTAWIDSAPREQSTIGQFGWPAAVSFALLLAIVSGGSSQADSAAFLLFRLLCVALFATALVRLAGTRLAAPEVITLLLAVAGVGLVALQLVPLPYGLFASLPGREFVTRVFAISGLEPRSMPMTLSPEATKAFLLALLPPLAVLAATMTVPHRMRWAIVAAVLAGSAANVLLGLAQRFQGAASGLYLYEITNRGSATGFFSNRNNFAMLLCVAIPLVWAMSHKLVRLRVLTPVMGVAAGAVMMLMIFMGLAAASSRSGILLGMLALTLSTLMVLSAPAASGRSAKHSRRARLSVLAVLGGAFVIGQFGMTGILRIVESDPLSDYRSEIRDVTLRAAADYFPLGSGFGTFTAVYGMHETPATMVSAFVNHAHNDWLELWLEGGLPAAALMGSFLVLFLYQSARIWNPRGPYAENVLPRAASIGVLVLLFHSLAEFPLRMPALACIFAALLAIMMAAPPHRHAQPRRHSTHPRREREEAPAAPAMTAPVAPPVFRVSREAGRATQNEPHDTLTRTRRNPR